MYVYACSEQSPALSVVLYPQGCDTYRGEITTLINFKTELIKFFLYYAFNFFNLFGAVASTKTFPLA